LLGDVKAIGNYAPAFQSQKQAKEEGFSEVLFLDARNDRYIEEVFQILCFDGYNKLNTSIISRLVLPISSWWTRTTIY
jgi:branched-chain amino acid aminotransferase